MSTTPSACASGTQTDKREGDRDVLNTMHWCSHKERENDRVARRESRQKAESLLAFTKLA
jgi:hypothetical protein